MFSKPANYIPSLNITADCLSSSSVFFPTKDESEGLQLREKEKVRIVLLF